MEKSPLSPKVDERLPLSTRNADIQSALLYSSSEPHFPMPSLFLPFPKWQLVNLDRAVDFLHESPAGEETD